MANRYRLPLKRSPKSDPQQYRVYRMENEAIGAVHYARLPLKKIRMLVRKVCRNYGVPLATVARKNLGTWAAMWCDKTITLNTVKGASRDLVTITHELAHHLHYWLSDGKSEEQQPHGPEFMACHISVLDTLRIIPVVGMRAVCDKWKIQYCDPGEKESLKKLIRITRGRHSPKH